MKPAPLVATMLCSRFWPLGLPRNWTIRPGIVFVLPLLLQAGSNSMNGLAVRRRGLSGSIGTWLVVTLSPLMKWRAPLEMDEKQTSRVTACLPSCRLSLIGGRSDESDWWRPTR